MIRAALRTILVLLLLPVVYLFLAVVGAIIPGQTAPVDPGPLTREIVLRAAPIHYDILLPADDETRAAFAFAMTDGLPVDHPGLRWISVGWGSAAFYTTAGTYADMKAATIWTAASGDRSVIRLEAVGELPEAPDIRHLRVSQAQLDSLRTGILRQMAADRRALPLAGFSDTDVFYPASGWFDIFRTCNVWVAARLREAGIPAGIWTPAPFSLTLSLWWRGQSAAARAG
jgi:uncharacterized protein (TIGR02117 family)